LDIWKIIAQLTDYFGHLELLCFVPGQITVRVHGQRSPYLVIEEGVIIGKAGDLFLEIKDLDQAIDFLEGE